MSESATLNAARVPNVYFIDDSATMREVIKIAFRKESVNVITCPDAASALAQFEQSAPDAVITDVIMPDKDGYEVCDFIKRHEQFGETPVILMSGVVNKTVAERATAVKADELIRKPFHPQDLIGRVKGLLALKFPALRSVAAPVGAAPMAGTAQPPAARVLTNFFAPAPSPSHVAVAANPAAVRRPSVVAPPATSAAEVQKLRTEIRRLELLVKKLQAELAASREYCTSLETEIRTLEG